MVAELVQQGHKIPPWCRPVQGVERIAEGYGETSPKSESEDSQVGAQIPGPFSLQSWNARVAWSDAGELAGPISWTFSVR